MGRPNFGFRCVAELTPAPPAAAAGLPSEARDFARERPVGDEVFRAYRGLYEYDRGELHARREERQTTAEWTREKVSFDAAYGGERMSVHLFLPTRGTPPFQSVVFFPGSGVMHMDRFDPVDVAEILDSVLRSGRAFVFPILKSTFERRDGWTAGGRPLAGFRDHLIMWSKDLGRTLDYLESRSDLNRSAVAYAGFSWGASLGPVYLAVESRFKAAVLIGGGLHLRTNLPEADTMNFVPRVTLPVLMLNGRYDDRFPLEQAQRPLFEALGTAERDRKWVLYDAGHFPLPRGEMVRETLAWLDKYLGPVKR